MLFNRSAEILRDYLALIDQHLKDVLDGKTDKMFELQEIAAGLFIHPTHLSNVIKAYTGHHPCYFYEEKILIIAKDLLKDPSNSIADVARKLTYDPSNFTKWFKTYGGMNPSAYRKQLDQAGSGAAGVAATMMAASAIVPKLSVMMVAPQSAAWA